MKESELLNKRVFLVKVTLKISQEKHILVTLCWKLIFGLMKLKN